MCKHFLKIWRRNNKKRKLVKKQEAARTQIMTKMPPLMKSLVPAIFLTLCSPLLLALPAGYYDGADSSSPEALRQSLHAIIDDHQRIP